MICGYRSGHACKQVASVYNKGRSRKVQLNFLRHAASDDEPVFIFEELYEFPCDAVACAADAAFKEHPAVCDDCRPQRFCTDIYEHGSIFAHYIHTCPNRSHQRSIMKRDAFRSRGFKRALKISIFHYPQGFRHRDIEFEL